MKGKILLPFYVKWLNKVSNGQLFLKVENWGKKLLFALEKCWRWTRFLNYSQGSITYSERYLQAAFSYTNIQRVGTCTCNSKKIPNVNTRVSRIFCTIGRFPYEILKQRFRFDIQFAYFLFSSVCLNVATGDLEHSFSKEMCPCE